MEPEGTSKMSIENLYHCDYALQVVEAAMEDYDEAYGG